MIVAKNPARSSDGRKRRRTEYGVAPERFIEVWEASESLEEVAAVLGMPKEIASARANNYRESGVSLKQFKRGGRKGLNVEALNAMIQRHRLGSGPKPEPEPKPIKSVLDEVLDELSKK
jgi:hypothetical protein